jgi:hypothetical protein
MTWWMPAELVLLAGVFALVFASPRLWQPTPHARLVLEVLLIALPTIATWAVAWALYWWIEQHW